MSLRHFSPQLIRLEKQMSTARDYATWRALAIEHDKLTGAEFWRYRRDNELFDADQIFARYSRLQACLRGGNPQELLFILNEGIHGNMGGMGSSRLYDRARAGTKKLIEEYVGLMTEALRAVLEASASDISEEHKKDFFRRASHCYGRSALSMSGGAGLIYFHHGVVDAMWQQGVLPTVISGASAGSWMAAQLGALSDAELPGYFASRRYISETYTPDFIMKHRSVDTLGKARDEVIDSFVTNMTFQEAFEHTGRHINISVAPYEKHQKSRLLNAMTSPNVTVRSAIIASSSLSGVTPPTQLEAKDFQGKVKPYLPGRLWVDGSLAADLPFKRLSRLYGVNHFIVSMINPMGLISLHDIGGNEENLYRSLKRVVSTITRESLRTTQRWAAGFERSKPLEVALGVAYRILNQSYIGDINIALDFKHVKLKNMLYRYDSDDAIREVYESGQRATWQKIEQIRMASLISREIDRCLEELDIAAFSPPGVGSGGHHPVL